MGLQLKDETAYKEWKERFDAISDVIANRKLLEEQYDALLKKTERLYSANLTPYNNRFAMSLYIRRLLPMLLPKAKRLTLLNMLMCESHYDRMLRMLKNYSK